MRVDQLVAAVTAMHVARSAYSRARPPSGLAPDEAGRAPPDTRLAPLRALSGSAFSASGLARQSPGAKAAPGPGVAIVPLAPGRAASARVTPGPARARGARPSLGQVRAYAGQAEGARTTRRAVNAPRKKSRKAVPDRFQAWLGGIVLSHHTASGPPLPPPAMPVCGAPEASPSARAPQPFSPELRGTLIDINMRKADGRASRGQAARRVDFARVQLAWICGAETDAEARQLAWRAVPRHTRAILREMQQLFSIWSPGAAATEQLRNLTLAAMVGGKGVPAFTADQICRHEWLRGAQGLVARNQAKMLPRTPLDCLLAVYQFRAVPASNAIGPDMKLREDVDVECLEAARLLFEQSRDPYFVPDYSGGLPAAQLGFRAALQEDLAEWLQAEALMPSGAPSYQFTKIWFDGMALREAAGQNATQIAQALHGRGMPLARARRLVTRRFRELGESPDYLIGTPQQSMASMVIRLGPHAGISPVGLEKVACLMEKFQLLEDRLMATATYPLSPTLLAARHSARGSGILASSGLTLRQLLTQEVRAHLLAGTAEWRASPVGANPALSFPWRHLAAMARVEHPLVDEPFRRTAVAMYKQLQLNREIILEPTVEALNGALLALFAERLSAYAPIPEFDEAQQAFDLLAARFNMRKAEIDLPHPYMYRVWVPGSRIPQFKPVVRMGSWVQEVLDRRRYAVESDRMMAHRGAALDARLDLDRARQAFDLGLEHTLPLQGKAKEVLRMRQQALAQTAINRLAGSIARNAQARTPEETLAPLTMLLARGMRVVGVLSPLEHIVDTIASGDPERIVDMLPFLGASYQIEQGMWHKNWKQAGMGVVRLGADAVFAWIAGLAEGEIVSTLAAALRESPRSSFEAPAVSMLRDFQRDSASSAPSRLAPDAQGEGSPGQAHVHEVNYGEQGAGAANEGRASPAFPPQYGDRPLSPADAMQRRTVEDSRSLLADMRRVWESSNQAQPYLACSWRDCLPFVQPARSPLDIADLIFSRDGQLATLIADMAETFGLSPTFQRLLAYGRSIERMPRWEAVRGGNRGPTTLLEAGLIQMPGNEVITGQSFVGASQSWPFNTQLTLLHEFTHAMTLRRDNPGPYPWLDRGPIIPLNEQIYYERNMPIPQRIAYQRHFSADESPNRHAQALAGHPVALQETLKENVELDGVFARMNRQVSGYTILGTPARERVTLARGSEVTSCLLHTLCDRPLVQDAAVEFNERVFTGGPLGADAELIQAEVRLAFASLLAQSELFAATAGVWLERVAGTRWQFVFDTHELTGTPVSAWQIDSKARTVHFNRKPLYYLDRGGPQVLTHERSLAGLFIELTHGHAFSTIAFDAASNRGPAILMENLMFDELGSLRQRVSAELSETPAQLWPSVGPASKAASDEDVRLEHLTAHLAPRATDRMEMLVSPGMQ